MSNKTLLACLCLSPYLPGAALAQGTADVALKDVRADHVIVSLSTPLFADLSAFLQAEFLENWSPRPEQGKGFIYPGGGGTFVELWDLGAEGLSAHFPVGYQVAVSSTDFEDGKRKATAYYGNEGLKWGPVLFTVGSNYAAGDPLGGTFFVSYGGVKPTPTVTRSAVSALTNLVTIMAQFRMHELRTYEAFGFSSREFRGGAEVEDAAGLRICLLARPSDDIFNFGHVALKFRLEHPAAERREVSIGDSKMLKAVFDGADVWLLLRADLFDPATPDQTCLAGSGAKVR